jgi:predicted TPR repeat methyltransferase
MSTVTNDDTIQAYDNGVQAYFDQSPQQVSAHVKEWIDASLEGLPTTAKIFEIGSGTGKDAAYFQSLGYDIEMTDASKGFVEYLNQNGYPASEFNVLTDGFGAKHDLIFADAVLLHFTENELKTILAKVSQALEPAGRFAFSIKQGDGESTESAKLGSPRYFHFWQPDQMRNLLQANGLHVIYQNIAEDSRGSKPAWILIVAEKLGQAS